MTATDDRLRSTASTLTLALALALTVALALLPASAAMASDERPGLVEVGQEAPAVALDGSEGASYRLEDRRGMGSTVLVFFRGTW